MLWCSFIYTATWKLIWCSEKTPQHWDFFLLFSLCLHTILQLPTTSGVQKDAQRVILSLSQLQSLPVGCGKSWFCFVQLLNAYQSFINMNEIACATVLRIDVTGLHTS